MPLDTAQQARNYLTRHTKGQICDNDFGLQVKDGIIKTNLQKKVRVDHVKTAEALVKFINMTPMLNKISRKIMTLKITNPGISIERISILCALRKDEIDAYEVEGVQVVRNFMRMVSIDDGVKAFEKNNGSFNPAQRYVNQHLKGVLVT